ncbi:MAG: DUF5671 domain-containing protein [Nitrospira sp.]
MEPTYSSQVKPKTSAKDFFLNLGAIVALYTLVYSLISLLFTVIDKIFPPITSGYYYNSTSISWPVATLVVFFPIFILLMWLLEREYKVEPERQSAGIHKWLTYITLFISGLVIAGDLITVLYRFIDGQNLTTAFILDVVVLLVVAVSVFMYYISDVRGKLTSKSRMVWRVASGVVIIGSIVWGFSVLGSPRTQQLLKYDQQKVNDLQNIVGSIESYYTRNKELPKNLDSMSNVDYYINRLDTQTGKSYEYEITNSGTYKVCADFNMPSEDYGDKTNAVLPINRNSPWTHPAGRYCFEGGDVPRIGGALLK